MKKLLLILAVAGLLASPASADMKLANFEHVGNGSVGVFAPPPTSGIYLDYKVVAEASDVIEVDFALHWPFGLTVYAGFIGHNFVWDSSEVQIIGMSPIAPFVAGNYNAPLMFPNPTSGTWSWGTFVELAPPNTTMNTTWPYVDNYTYTIAWSDVVPFVHVTLHVKDVINDSFLDLVITSCFVDFAFSPGSPGGWWTNGDVGVPSYGMGIIPEPASMTLLAGGLLAIGAGVWRRRR